MNTLQQLLTRPCNIRIHVAAPVGSLVKLGPAPNVVWEKEFLPEDVQKGGDRYVHSHLSASIFLCAGSHHDMFSVYSIVIRFLAISSFTRSRHLSFGLPRFRFPSTVICNIFLVVSSLSLLCTCPNHLNLFSLNIKYINYIFQFHFSHFLTYVCSTPTPALISSASMFAIFFIPIIPLNILISLLSTQSCSAFVSVQVELSNIRTCHKL